MDVIERRAGFVDQDLESRIRKAEGLVSRVTFLSQQSIPPSNASSHQPSSHVANTPSQNPSSRFGEKEKNGNGEEDQEVSDEELESGPREIVELSGRILYLLDDGGSAGGSGQTDGEGR
jgi:hypothetical protein